MFGFVLQYGLELLDYLSFFLNIRLQARDLPVHSLNIKLHVFFLRGVDFLFTFEFFQLVLFVEIVLDLLQFHLVPLFLVLILLNLVCEDLDLALYLSLVLVEFLHHVRVDFLPELLEFVVGFKSLRHFFRLVFQADFQRNCVIHLSFFPDYCW